MDKFIIFAHARSGSTSLARALKFHPEVSIIEEPFSRSRDTWSGKHIKYRDGLNTDVSSLDLQLSRIFTECNSFKHLQGQLPEEFNKRLLLKGHNIVFLYRENLLQAAVSREISIQSNHWGSDRNKVLNHTYDAIDIPRMETFIEFVSRRTKLYKSFLEENDISYISISYEKLFGSAIENRLKVFQEIEAFLAISDRHKQRNIKKILSPAAKLNRGDTYSKIPNIAEVVAQFKDYGDLNVR